MRQPNTAGGENAALSLSPDVPSACSQMSPDVPRGLELSPDQADCENEPKVARPQLSPIQLAAARAFAKGARTQSVAQALRLNRRTLSRWKRLPEFRVEIERIHRRLSAPPPRLAPSSSQQVLPTERQFLNNVFATAVKQWMKL